MSAPGYYYLVTKYFGPTALLDGVWSIRILPLSTVAVIILSESFFTRRVYLFSGRFRSMVVVAPVLMLVIFGFGIATTAEAFIRPTFAGFDEVAWMTSAAFGIAVVVDSLLTGMLIHVLQQSRTGFKRTDSLLDVLIIYAVNTGLLTGIFSLLSFIFALVAPDNLIYSGFNIIAAKFYANSLLAVLNSRQGLTGMDKVQSEDCFASCNLSLYTLQDRTTTPAQTWNVPEVPRARERGRDGHGARDQNPWRASGGSRGCGEHGDGVKSDLEMEGAELARPRRSTSAFLVARFATLYFKFMYRDA